jgi:hypothetical protein
VVVDGPWVHRVTIPARRASSAATVAASTARSGREKAEPLARGPWLADGAAGMGFGCHVRALAWGRQKRSGAGRARDGSILIVRTGGRIDDTDGTDR